MSESFQGVNIRKFGMRSGNWEGPITLTLDGKNINWVYDSGTNMQWDEDKGEMLMWTYAIDCRNINFFAGLSPSLKKNRIDITLKVPVQSDNRGHSEIGKPYAFEFKDEDDYDRAVKYLKKNVGDDNHVMAACNQASLGYGKDGFENFKRDMTSMKGGKRKRKTKRKMSKRKKMQKKRKTNKRKKSTKRK